MIEKPARPKHVPFWPWLVGFVFLIVVVAAGTVASNHARNEKSASAVTTTTIATTSSCQPQDLLDAALSSGQVDEDLLGHVSVSKAKCVSGYGLATLMAAKTGQSVAADFQQVNGQWKMLRLGGDIDLRADGIPDSVAAALGR